nr:immunoglobulin light chain junction region [Macaca mulatta]MOX80076.1 immunoglobulin light chain junction region [Macaca mulatta]MOX80166.1 immunoglobulin light chain junction region [Macaca mulatta]MOX80846.1 immunoglobulin light chain junction region [Macaca mulatta]MOX82787.1 immunoglobulin light chain junction region [Macaca mulatta]
DYYCGVWHSSASYIF